MTKLQEIINNLKLKQEVDGVLIAGSQGAGEEKPYSDIDLVVVLSKNSKNIRSIFEWTDGKPMDTYFFDQNELKKLMSLEEVPANKMDAVLVDWIFKSKIEFDKSGVLSELKDKSIEIKKKFAVPTEEMRSFENKINCGYITNKRYFDSNNPIYLEALEIKLLFDISNVLVGYFEFRNIPWRGEKFAVTYLKENDAIFYKNFKNSVSGADVADKFKAYEKMVESVFTGEYSVWDKNIIKPFCKEPISEETEKEIVEYWNGLKS